MKRTTLSEYCDLLWLAISAAAAVSNSGCVECDVKKACLVWVTVGESYRVELTQGLAFGSDPVGGLYAFQGHPNATRTCGVGFDLEVGQTIAMAAAERRADEHNDSCGCFDVNAEAAVPGVAVSKKEVDVGGTPHSGFLKQAQVRFAGGCTGRYSLSVAPVPQRFLDLSGRYIATDHVLYRSFVPDDAAKCRVEGSQIDEKGAPDGCWDAWAVKILDASGKSITRSFAMRGDAGTNTADEDAGRTPATDDGGNAP